MSHSITGVAAISFPLPVLQGDAYGIPEGYRALTPVAPDALRRDDPQASAVTKTQPEATAAKVVKARQAPVVDTVTLSTAQKVLKLQREGETALQIAATLDIPTKEVQSDLHTDTHVPQSFTVAPVTTPLSGNTRQA